MRAKTSIKRILVFDSGLGGLTVVAAIQEALPDLDISYLADNLAFPYGKLDHQQIIARVTSLMKDVIQHLHPDVIIIACNTASTTALETLRKTFPATRFLGVVPPIKPAGKISVTRQVGLLATKATAYGDYTNELIERYAADCQFTLVTDPALAILAEDKLYKRELDPEKLKSILFPIIQKPDIDTIVLGCTHYPHLLAEMQLLLPQKITWLNPAPGVAKHLKTVLQKIEADCPAITKPPKTLPGKIKSNMFFTKIDNSVQKITPILTNLGLTRISHQDFASCQEEACD